MRVRSLTKRVAQAQQGRPLDVLLWEAEALADDVAQLVGGDVVVCGEELGEPPTAKSFARRCLDDDDVGPRGDLVGCLDIARRFARLLHHLGVGRVEGWYLSDEAAIPAGMEGAATPKALSKVARSLARVGEP